jgi:hypothetical protein
MAMAMHRAAQLYRAHVNRTTAFTRYMEASHRRSDERAQRVQDAAEARANDAAGREARNVARDRFAQQITLRETHWIKWATIVIAIAAVIQMVAASIQARAALRPPVADVGGTAVAASAAPIPGTHAPRP